MDQSMKTTRKRNPIDRANPLSKYLFSYMIPIFFKAYKHPLEEEDLCAPPEQDTSDYQGERLENKLKQEQKKQSKQPLLKALFRVFGCEWITIGIFQLISDIIIVVGPPIAIGKMVSYFDVGQTTISQEEVLLYAGLYVLVLLANRLIIHNVMMANMHIAMKIRIACSSVLYRKALRLSRESLEKTTVGQLVNLLSSDVSKFDQTFVAAHFAHTAPIQTAIGTYLIYREIGPYAFIGIALLVSFIPLQVFFSKRTSEYRFKTAIRTDERVRFLNEIVSGIQVIKMYCWEKPFAKLIAEVRQREMNAIRKRLHFIGVSFSFESFLTRTSIFFSILAYVLMGNNITAQKVFAVTAIYNVIRPAMANFFFRAISGLAEVRVSIERLNKFLCYDEHEIYKRTNAKTITSELYKYTSIEKKNNVLNIQAFQKVAKISLHNFSGKWFSASSENTLKNLNVEWTDNKLIAIIGLVGSGKSSFLNALLEEMIVTNGTSNIEGRISYASQEPWLFASSVRQNILFGQPYDKLRYDEVVKVCALQSDFDLFPHGDNTLIGEKGKTLSGGQKARISLARCVYAKADIYLLDDPLSAVDARVGKHLYKQCIESFLKNKMRILVTHQLQYLRTADEIVLMDEGQIRDQGNYSHLQSSGANFAKMLQRFSSQEEEEKSKSRQNSVSVEEESEADKPVAEAEQIGTGSISFKTLLRYLGFGGNIFGMLFLLALFITSNSVTYGGDYFVAYWVNLEQVHAEHLANTTTVTNDDGFNRNHIIYYYSGIIIATIILALSQIIIFMNFMVRISINIHNSTFTRLLQATMNFFNENPSGRILNRFSKDLSVIDEYIPMVLNDVLQIFVLALSVVIISATVEPWLILPSIIVVGLCVILRNIYITTGRHVKRIEGRVKSPMFTHMAASMNGLTTIRSSNAENLLIKEFDNYQDQHSSAWFMFLATNRCFGFYLDMMTAVFVGVAIIIMIFSANVVYGGNIGLVVTQYIVLCNLLQWGVRQSSELENSLVSVERVLEYTQLKEEPVRSKVSNVDKDWPKRSSVEFQNVKLRYNSMDPYVLKDITFKAEAGEKIGIVGRTGAGKSSIISALFQLYEIEGNIIIDKLDTTKLPLDYVRSKISIIPQEPVLFSGTMRRNLDPFNEFNDEVLWNALEQVELKETVSEMQAGLNSAVTEGGNNFSVGQRQLVCLARALIRNNKVLILDEATANVDPQTDGLIQTTIRTKFADCTVFTIAHRLHTVMDSDKILVMNAGRVEEFDHPHLLLQNKHGLLRKLVDATGNNTASNLQALAEQNYNNKRR